MEKKSIQFGQPEKQPSQSYVTVQIPESTWHLFHAVFEQTPLSQEEKDAVNAQTNHSLSVNGTLYPAPEEYSDHGAPRGTFLPGMLPPSAFYPDSPHPYWVYVPAAYDPARPANLAVFLDGPMYTTDPKTREPLSYPDTLLVLDNLIHDGKIETRGRFLRFTLCEIF